MNACLGCLKQKKLKNGYCQKCIDEIFNGENIKKLDFNQEDFFIAQDTQAIHLSISGVQDKISLSMQNGKLAPTNKNGRYILKPTPSLNSLKSRDDIPANEHLSMQISAQIFKIPTAKCSLIRFQDDKLAFITKRFDYLENGKKYDQEDFASILNVNSAKNGSSYKYDSKTYEDMANAIKLHVLASDICLDDLFKRILLNYLIANGDAHLKNFSLFSHPNSLDYRLTPNYDILNTRLHVNEVFGDMAMEFMSENTKEFESIGYYSFKDFEVFASKIGMNKKRFEKHIKLANSSKKAILEMAENSYLSDSSKEFYIKTFEDRLKRVNYNLKK